MNRFRMLVCLLVAGAIAGCVKTDGKASATQTVPSSQEAATDEP